MSQGNVFTRITVTKAADKDSNINAGQYPSFVVNLAQSVTGVTSAELGDAITRSENAANAAKASQTAAKTSETNAKASADASASNLANIKDSEAKAKASADAAKTSQTAAAGSATAAKASQTAAKTSEDAAAASAASISDEVEQTAANAAAAKASEAAAKASQTAAKTSETNAKTSETAAKASQTAAATSATGAASSATAAGNSATAAKTSETNSKSSETASATAKLNAEESAAAAKASQTAAKTSEEAAKASQLLAKNSETNAGSSKTAATNSATAAKASEDKAKASETAAKSSESAAKTSETAASDSATASANSATAAANSATAAKASENAAALANTDAQAAKVAAKSSADNAASSAVISLTSSENASASELNAKASAEESEASAVAAKASEDAAKEAVIGLPSIENTDKRYAKVRTAIPNGTDLLEYFRTAKSGFYFSTKDVINGFGEDANYTWTNGRDDVTTEGDSTGYGTLLATTYGNTMHVRVLSKGLWNGVRDVLLATGGLTAFEDLIVQKSAANRLKLVVGATQRENRISFHNGMNPGDGFMSAYIGFNSGSNGFMISNEVLGTKPAIELSDNIYYWASNYRTPITTERSLGGSSFFPRGVVGWNSTPPAYNAGSGMYKMGQGADDATIIQFGAQDDKMYAASLQFRFNRAALGSLKYRIAGFNSTDFPMGWLDLVGQITGKQYYRDDNAFFGAGTNTDAGKFGMPNTGTMIQSKYAENRKGQIFIGEDGSIQTRWVGETGKGGNIAWIKVLDANNTTRDPNGFVKIASPIVKLFKDEIVTNNESEGVTLEKVGTGHYIIKGVMGFNSDGGWGVNGGVVVPKDENDQPIMWVKSKVLPSGDIEVKTFHRQHKESPEAFQNWRVKEVVDGTAIHYKDGDIVDIPDTTWIDIRVEMPETSIYNEKRRQAILANEKLAQEMEEALELERLENLDNIERTEQKIKEDGWTLPPPAVPPEAPAELPE